MPRCPQHCAAKVLPHGHVGEDVGYLKRARQSTAVDLIGCQTRHDLIAKQDLALGWHHVAADEVEQRGLSRAVGADDGVPFSRRDLEVDVADHGRQAEALFDIAQFDCGAHATVACSGGALVAPSHACATHAHVWRASTKPMTVSASAMPHVRGLAVLKGRPNARMFGSSLGFVV